MKPGDSKPKGGGWGRVAAVCRPVSWVRDTPRGPALARRRTSAARARSQLDIALLLEEIPDDALAPVRSAPAAMAAPPGGSALGVVVLLDAARRETRAVPLSVAACSSVRRCHRAGRYVVAHLR